MCFPCVRPCPIRAADLVHRIRVHTPGLEWPPDDDSIEWYDWAHIADWYRAAALAKFGGVWMDSTVIMTRPLEDFIDLGGALQGFGTVGTIENWSSAAPSSPTPSESSPALAAREPYTYPTRA